MGVTIPFSMKQEEEEEEEEGREHDGLTDRNRAGMDHQDAE
jgi:hypothetical protein